MSLNHSASGQEATENAKHQVSPVTGGVNQDAQPNGATSSGNTTSNSAVATTEAGTAPAPTAYTGPDRRACAIDRRASVERRVVDIGSPTGLERRRGPGRRRTDDRRSAEEGEMTDEQFEFVLAIDTYKRLNNRPFPSWTEVLEVIKQLGYRKVAASTLSLQGLKDRKKDEGGGRENIPGTLD